MEGFAPSLLQTIIIIFCLGYLGYRVFKLFHMPGGAIMGAMIMVAIISSRGVVWAKLPSYSTVIFQVVIGITIGCKFSKEQAYRLKSLIIPGVIVSVWMLCTGLGAGILLTRFTNFDLGTALYGSVPGGMSEMCLMALSYNLNVPVVSMLQTVRVIVVNVSVPLIATRFGRAQREVAVAEQNQSEKVAENGQHKDWGVLSTLIIGGCGGFIAKYLGVPVGGLLGAMIVVGVLRILGMPLTEPPKRLIIFSHICLGGYLGTTFTTEVAEALMGTLLPALLFSSALILSGIVLAFCVHRLFGWDLPSSLLACAAAGVTQMSATALDMDADAVLVGLVQVIRLTIILLLMPTIIVTMTN
jgi:membrane AbrB-like protein